MGYSQLGISQQSMDRYYQHPPMEMRKNPGPD